jgi:hypothetical protein
MAETLINTETHKRDFLSRIFTDIGPGHRCENFLAVNYTFGEDVPGTATVRIHCPEGFIIAADGLVCHGDGKPTDQKDKQKVFQVENDRHSVAFALTGVTQIDGPTGVFDISAESTRIARTLLQNNYDSGDCYIQNFGNEMLGRFKAGKEDGRIGEFLTGYHSNLIYSALFVGFYSGKPFMAMSCTNHEGQEIQPSTTSFTPLSETCTRMEVSGSKEMYGILANPADMEFRSYRCSSWDKLRRGERITISDGRDLAKSFIAACSDPKAQKIEKELETVGGRIHVAQITKDRGFRWLDAPAGIYPALA